MSWGIGHFIRSKGRTPKCNITDGYWQLCPEIIPLGIGYFGLKNISIAIKGEHPSASSRMGICNYALKLFLWVSGIFGLKNISIAIKGEHPRRMLSLQT
jgi:hypothetical protein